MKDYHGDELETGWYWYSHSHEGDIFYPVYINLEINKFLIDGKRKPLVDLEGFNLFKAVLPEV